MQGEKEDKRFQMLVDAILRLRWCFEAGDFGPPTAIHLAKSDNGYRFEAWLRTRGELQNYVQYHGSPQVVAFDGQPWRQVSICGVAIRWPARVDALEGGGIRIS